MRQTPHGGDHAHQFLVRIVSMVGKCSQKNPRKDNTHGGEDAHNILIRIVSIVARMLTRIGGWPVLVCCCCRCYHHRCVLGVVCIIINSSGSEVPHNISIGPTDTTSVATGQLPKEGPRKNIANVVDILWGNMRTPGRGQRSETTLRREIGIKPIAGGNKSAVLDRREYVVIDFHGV